MYHFMFEFMKGKNGRKNHRKQFYCRNEAEAWIKADIWANYNGYEDFKLVKF